MSLATKPQDDAPSFSDKRVFLAHSNDHRCGMVWDESDAGYTQADDGPTYLIIGRTAPDDKLQKMASRYHFTLEELKAFRDAPIMKVLYV